MQEYTRHIVEHLARYNHLREAILKDVRWLRYGSAIALDFVLWQDSSADEDSVELTIHCGLVVRFNLTNDLTTAMAVMPEAMNWGFSEIAMVIAEDPLDERAIGHLPMPFVQLRVLWEGQQEIDILASQVEFREGEDG